MVYLHILPEEYEKSDYVRMNEVLQAKAKKDRPVDAFTFMQSQRDKPRKFQKGGK